MGVREDERTQDVAAFDALVDAPTWEIVYEALRRADELALTSRRRGPRVCVAEAWRIFVRVDFDYKAWGPSITFRVEDFNGKALNEISWPEDENVEDVMFRVGRAVERATSGGGLDLRALFRGLRDALVAAHTHPDRRPIWQLCPPQWAVTADRIVTYPGIRVYGILKRDLLRDVHLGTQVLERSWVDSESFADAQAVAAVLHEDAEALF